MISQTSVDSILKDLLDLEDSLPSDMKDQFFKLWNELVLLRIYMLCLAKWNDSTFGKDKNFGFVEESRIETALEEAASRYRMSKWEFTEFLELIQGFKPKIEEDCLDFFHCPFQCEFSSDELPYFMYHVSHSLQGLLGLNVDIKLDLKMKTESLKDNLELFREVFEFTAKRCSSPEDFKDLKLHTQAWACSAACVPLLYWVLDVKEENTAERMVVILSDLQKKISPSNPEVTRMYLAVLKASKPSTEDKFMVGKLVMKFIEFLKDNLQVDLETDGVQMFFVDLIFMLTFLMDRPEAENFSEGKLILTEADAVVNEVASLIISSLSTGKTKDLLLHTFLEKATTIKAKVRKLYARLFPDPASFNFPKVDVMGFIDLLLENLKEYICFHFPKRQIMMLQEELFSLKESNFKDFSSILKLQNKPEEVKNLWTRIINVAYGTERAVSSFVHIKDSLWHDILCISDAIKEIKLIKGEVKRIYDIHSLNSKLSSNLLLPLQTTGPTVDKLFVGFKDEVEEILGQLISGTEELHFISIVGMPGLGKTTLAKKVYSDASVRYHFHKCAWCTVSQAFNGKKILLQILSDLGVRDDNLSKAEEEDLAERLYRSLKGQRYIIVIDDIWDISAWNAVKISFPDDNNGSRIVFTSRIHNLISKAKPGSSPFPLSPLSGEESWELLKKKLFGQDSCPSDFVHIGKRIATNCKGLPLSIVLIAGLLKGKIESLDWWEQVEESLHSLITKEGCGDVLELSYKHLPEFLKPCFLYLGLFDEDEEIRMKKLTLLWNSEGFLEKHESKSLDVVAEEYVMDLVARSLVIVTKRNYMSGRIKACNIHDLLRDFCIAKGEEEKVFKLIRGNEDWDMATTHAHYRVGIPTYECSSSFLKHVPPASATHSLLTSPHIRWRAKYFDFPTVPYFKFLRVLDLYLWLHGFPEGITELILLRYLALHCRNLCIPQSTKKLKNLETLHLESVKLDTGEGQTLLGIHDLSILLEMQNLRHIEVPSIPDPPFSSSFYDCDEVLSPSVNVQTFSFLNVPFGEASVEILRKIPRVRELKLGYIPFESFGCDQRIVKLDFLSHLESLSIVSLYDWSPELNSLAFYLPWTLKKLKLTDFQFLWSELSPIAELPNLEVLKLCGGSCDKTWNVGDGEFLKLKCLVLRQLRIEQLDASDDSFPCLELFEIEYCRRLKEIPPRFGEISTLKMIRVENCRSNLQSSVRQIQEDQLDLGNQDFEVRMLGKFEEGSSDSDREKIEENSLDSDRDLSDVSNFFFFFLLLLLLLLKNCRSKLQSSVREIQEDQLDLGNQDFEVRMLGKFEEGSSDSDREKIEENSLDSDTDLSDDELI